MSAANSPISASHTTPDSASAKHSPSHPSGWSDSDLVANPHLDEHKPEKVRSMFSSIARSYDLNNRLHSLWMDVLWRKFAVKKSLLHPGDAVLDVACGTGDLTLAFARSHIARPSKVVGLDFTQAMLDIATHKSTPPHSSQAPIHYIQGDAMNLPFDDASFDILSIAFGIRNVLDPAKAIREFRRVLRPSGRLIILEFAEPPFAPVRWFNNLYAKRIMPLTATLISRDRSGAYKYLPRSVESFMSPDDLKTLLLQAGFIQPTDWPLSLGICRCYRALTPPYNTSNRSSCPHSA